MRVGSEFRIWQLIQQLPGCTVRVDQLTGQYCYEEKLRSLFTRYGEVLGTTISSAPLSTGDDDQRSRSKAETQADEDIAAHNNMSLFGNAFGPRDMVRFYTTATSRHSDSSTHSDSLFNDAKRSCDCWL